MRIEKLIASIGESIQDAHKFIKLNYINNFFNDYFDKEGSETSGDLTYTPKMVEISFSNTNNNKIISAPVAALVDHANMNIDYIKVNLNINVTNQNDDEIEITSPPKNDNNDTDNSNSGAIEILFRSKNAPEGISRLETQLNSGL